MDMRWLGSPLIATGVVVVGLWGVSYPLRRLTSGVESVVRVSPVEKRGEEEKLHAVIRVKHFEKIRSLRVSDERGLVVLEVKDLEAGEHEYDVTMRIHERMVEWKLGVEMEDGGGETAVFMTVMPDGMEDRTNYVIGEGMIEELIRYEWKP